jgi:hypothetical protein
LTGQRTKIGSGHTLAYEEILGKIFEETDGLTPAEVFDAFRRLNDRAVVSKYLALEFPHTRASLQNIMVTTMLQLGYETKGERRRKRSFRQPVFPRPRLHHPPRRRRRTPLHHLQALDPRPIAPLSVGDAGDL